MTVVRLVVDIVPSLATILLAAWVAFDEGNTKSDLDAIRRLAQWIVILLAVSVGTQLIERLLTLRDIAADVKSARQTVDAFFSDKASALDFFYKGSPPIRDWLAGAKDIFASGVVMQEFVLSNSLALGEIARNGGTIRVLAVDPNGPSAISIANPPDFPVSYIRSNADLTAETMRWLQREAASSNTNAVVELRYVECVPFTSITSIDVDRRSGRVVVGWYRQRWGREERPYAVLTKERDSLWFDYFRKQADELWELGVKQELDGPSATTQ